VINLKLVFLITQGSLPWQPNFVGFSACIPGRKRLVAQPGGLTLGFALVASISCSRLIVRESLIKHLCD